MSNCLQFECTTCSLTYNNSVIDIIVVYRPPPTQLNQLHTNEFLEEWTEFLSHHTSTTAGLVVVGDLNIHKDNASHTHTKTMTQILQSNGLQQHVHEPTQCVRHTLVFQEMAQPYTIWRRKCNKLMLIIERQRTILLEVYKCLHKLGPRYLCTRHVFSLKKIEIMIIGTFQ